ncbi:MAG: IclR family transcriptional regulator [Chloroflexota bacterium]|nr:MAG: IclR family transcriptional regulator [Chloroflexota bacterium]
MVAGVQSVERAFRLLELLGSADDFLAISDLARMSGLPLGTTHRLLDTLVQLEYVERDPHSRRYTLGLKTLQLRGAVIGHMNLGMQAMPVMKALMQQVNETVHLAVLNDGEIVYIDRIEGLHTQGMYTRIGKRAPAHCTALGKVLLAFLPQDGWREVVSRRGLRRFTPHTITSVEELERELATIRERQFAIDDEEVEIGVRCVAAPVRDYSGEVVAAVSISGPISRVFPERDRELAEAICWAGRLISAKLGYLGR